MKITLGRLKKLIVEASAADMNAKKVDIDYGFDIGKYYIVKGAWDRDEVCRVDNIFTTFDNVPLVIFKHRADSQSQQALKFWGPKVVREATAEEASAAEEKWAADEEHMSRTIDTSREGT